MSNPLKELDNALGILSDVDKIKEEPWNYEHKVVSVDKEKDIESDYEYQRQNFYNLVEKGTAAIDGILLLAKESEHPRTYEVAGKPYQTSFRGCRETWRLTGEDEETFRGS